ncbi:MAG: AMP-binding protein [Bacteroidales bacterium]|nr:AMP-binding protein [Bacteroidales bacterium]
MTERLTIVQFVEKYCEKYAQNTFLREKVDGVWTETTFSQTKAQAYRIAAGFMSLGLQKGDKVCLLSEGRNLWILGELGILYTGAVNVPLSVSLDENELLFRINHSEARYILVSRNHLSKVRKTLDQCPALEKVIVLDELDSYQDKEICINEVAKLGDAFLAEHKDEFVARYTSILPDDYATISYTSGTTADPKGILLTHRNYTANVEQASTAITIPPDYVMLIILPLDHCFAHVAGFYIMMYSGASIATVPAGKGGMEALRNIPIAIKEIRPHVMLSVPALSKNFKKGIEAGIKKKSPTIQKLYDFAVKNAIAYNKEVYNAGGILNWWRKPLMALFDKLVFQSVREAGFGGRMKFFVGGGALLDIDLQRYYYAIGVPIFQGYGLSEATPIICANSPVRYVMGSSGRLVQPMECKICDSDGNEVPAGQLGEIVVKGENVMAGYWKNPKSTAETVREGWLHTGDMGYIWPEDHRILYVVGRFKALLISSDGEKYSPELMEESYVEGSKYIDGAVLHNSQDPYTILLMVPNKDALKEYIKEKFPTLDIESAEAKDKMLAKLGEEVNMFRKGGSHAGQFPEKWLPAATVVLPEPFTAANGQLNSTSKVVRRKVEEAAAQAMAFAYTPEGKNIVNELNRKAL